MDGVSPSHEFMIGNCFLFKNYLPLQNAAPLMEQTIRNNLLLVQDINPSSFYYLRPQFLCSSRNEGGQIDKNFWHALGIKKE